MKVVLPKEMARIEKIAYSEGFKEELFMENAGRAVAEATNRFAEEFNLEKSCLLLIAKGGNSGDAFVAGRYLIEKGWIVRAFEPVADSSMADLTEKNRARYAAIGGSFQKELAFDTSLILDGLFGTGFHGTIEEPYLSTIEKANASGLPILSIDIPSGLSGASGEVGSVALLATRTFALALPKVGLFVNKGWEHVGELEILPFGLTSRYIREAEADFELIEFDKVAALLPVIHRRQHKYQRGSITALAGSLAMPGAAELALLGALRGGAGIAKLLVKEEELSLPLSPELLRLIYRSPDEALTQLQTGKAALIGPGLGRGDDRFSLLWHLLPRLNLPTVIDGDALFFIAKENPSLPAETILTPHEGEMARLLGMDRSPGPTREFLSLCSSYANDKNVTLILKGAPTFIFYPGKPTLISPFGSPGMATAGSGDLLSGILAAQLARGLPPREAALFAVSLHGIAGELAAQKVSPYSLIARDILEALPSAFWELF